jgi:ribosome small subunit-dependent GTPase A
MRFNELHLICALIFFLPTLSLVSRRTCFRPKQSDDGALQSVKRRPDRFAEWEVRKKGESNQQKDPNGNTASVSKAVSYRNAVADSSKIADSTSLINRRTKPPPASVAAVNVTRNPECKTGLVIERLGGSLLVEVNSTDDSPRYNVICYQRSTLTDSVIVVGDTVDLLLVTPSATNVTLQNSNVNGDMMEIKDSFEDQSEMIIPLTGSVDEPKSSGADEKTIIEPLVEDHTSEQLQSPAAFLPLQGVVLGHHERLNLLQRPSPFNSGTNAKNKVIAANIDQIILVVSAVPIVPLSSIDRILVAAHEYDMEAIILLNKMDLEGSEELFSNLQRYSAMGYPVLKVSVKTKEGLQDLRDTLKDKCSIFVGQSGIGKSSLVNTLLPDEDYKAKIGALVRSANLGAHTTSSARLFHLPEGGRIIDSPGIRELGLWHLSEASIRAGFREIDSLTDKCKFRNCKHTEETLGCAVQRGIRDGIVHPDRLQSYFTFLE